LGADIGALYSYTAQFSGKLSSVMPNSNEQPDVALPLPEAPQEPSRAWRTRLPAAKAVREVGGVSGPEPTRYGDWELRGRCIDF
jgi:hypothetical protein